MKTVKTVSKENKQVSHKSRPEVRDDLDSRKSKESGKGNKSKK